LFSEEEVEQLWKLVDALQDLGWTSDASLLCEPLKVCVSLDCLRLDRAPVEVPGDSEFDSVLETRIVKQAG
jgi:hypothetical protein